MTLLNITKEPWEKIVLAGAFGVVLTSGESILDAPASRVTAVNSLGENVSNTFLDQSTIMVDGSYLKIRCNEGVKDESYSVNFRIETSLGERWETNTKIRVKEIGFALVTTTTTV